VEGRALNQQLRWFQTTNDPSDPSLEVMGLFNLRSRVSSNETIEVMVAVDFSFKGLLDPTTIGPVLKDYLLSRGSKGGDDQLPPKQKLSRQFTGKKTTSTDNNVESACSHNVARRMQYSYCNKCGNRLSVEHSNSNHGLDEDKLSD